LNQTIENVNLSLLTKKKEIKIKLYKKEENARANKKMKLPRFLHFSQYKLATKLVVVVLIIFVFSGIAYYFNLKSSVLIDHEGESPIALLANSSDQIAKSGLLRDGDARINILILGKGGEAHAGGNLTDSIQILSLDIFNNEASMLSIPRDFYVKSEVGSTKINAVYSTANGKKKDSGGSVMKNLVSDITDLTIHYFLVIDFDGFSTLIDSLGGISLNVENTINDDQYPVGDEAGSTETFYLKAGWQNLDGETALKFVRSRHTPGVEGSDFARSARQQRVLAAVKEKALSIGVLANPVKFLNMIDILGRHLKTDIPPNDLKLLLTRSKDIKTDEIKSAVLSNSQAGLLTNSTQFGTYALIPSAGFNNYTDIQKLMHSLAHDPLVVKENASIRILHNGNDSKKKADDLSELLKSYGYNIVGVETTDQVTSTTEIISYEKDKNLFTLHFLEQRLQVAHQIKKGNDHPAAIDIIVR